MTWFWAVIVFLLWRLDWCIPKSLYDRFFPHWYLLLMLLKLCSWDLFQTPGQCGFGASNNNLFIRRPLFMLPYPVTINQHRLVRMRSHNHKSHCWYLQIFLWCCGNSKAILCKLSQTQTAELCLTKYESEQKWLGRNWKCPRLTHTELGRIFNLILEHFPLIKDSHHRRLCWQLEKKKEESSSVHFKYLVCSCCCFVRQR